MRTCLREKEKHTEHKWVKDLAEGDHKVTDRVEKVADADQVADGKKIINEVKKWNGQN